MKGNRMKMRKGFRKALSLVTAGLMALSLITVTGTPEKVTAAGEGTTYDAASQVNFSTTLGRAVDFGLTAGKITQNGHMETTIATNLFKNGGANNDVDLAGDSPAHFIIGDLDGDSKIVLGKTYNDGPMIYNVETTTKVAEKDSDGKYKYILPDNNCKADIVVKTEEADTINNNINRMIGHAKDESDAMLKKATLNLSDTSVMDATHPPHVYIDLTDEQYDGRAVYINANDNDVLLAALQNTGQLHIKKRSNTVIVFNVKGFESTQLNINKYFVQVLQDDGSLGEEISSGDQTYSGNDSTHNQDIDREIAQKIIWNVPNATNVRIDNTAGTFLVMDPDAFVSVGSSAGWCVTPGEISTHGEWHYIYHGRSNDVNSNEKFDKEMHFAARKAFTESITNVNEIKTQSLEDGEYTFYFYETGEDYSTEGKTPKFTQTNDATSKIKFGILSFSDADFAEGSDSVVRHYVIKEADAGTYKNGIRNTTGEVDIELTVKKKDDGSMSFYVYANYYLTKEDKDNNKPYKTHENGTGKPIEMSDVEFSLGAFFNEVTGDVGTLRVKKQVKGDLDSSVAAAKSFKISVTNESNKYVNLDGTTSSTAPDITIKDGETLEFKNLPYGKYKIVEDTTDESINVPGYDLTVSGANNETVEISSDTIVSKTITNTYNEIKPVSVDIKKIGDDSEHSDGLAGAVFSVSKDGAVQTGMGWTSEVKAHTIKFTEEGTYIIHEEKAPNQYKVADDVTIVVKKVGHELKAYNSNGTLINSTVPLNITDKLMVPNRIGSITINKSIEGDGDETELLNKLITKGTYFVIKCTGQTGGTSQVGNYLKMVDGSTIASSQGGPYAGEKVGEFTSNEAEAHILLNKTNFTKNADGKYSLTLTRIVVDEDATYTYEVTEYKAGEAAATYTWTVTPTTGTNTVSLSSTATNGTAAFTNTYTEKKGYLAVTKSVEANPTTDALPDSISSKWFYFTITNEAGKYIDENGEVSSEKKILKLRKGETVKVKNALPAGKYTVSEIKKDTANGIDADIQYYTFDDTTSVTSTTVTVDENYTELAPVTAGLKNVYIRQKGSLKVTKKAVNAPDSMKNHQYKIGIKDEEGYYWLVDESRTPAVTKRAADKNTSGLYPLKNGEYTLYENLPVGLYTVIENVDDASIAEYNLTITGDKKADDGYLDYGEGHHYVVNGEQTNVTVVNTYKDIDTGSIAVTKKLSGVTDTIKNDKVFEFIVTTENGKKAVLDDKGTLGDLANAKKFTIKDNGTVVEVKNLPLGKYQVKEVETSIPIEGYTLNTSSKTASQVLEIATKNEVKEFELINTYNKDVEKGSLTITKAKDTESAEIPDTVKFPVKVKFDTAGKYTVTQGSTTTTPDFAANTDVTYNLSIGESVTISNVPVDVGYTVTESIPLTMTEYTNTGITNGGTGKIVAEGSEVTVTNKRTIVTEKGNLKITKTIKGDITDEDFTGLTFTVKKGDQLVGEYTLGKDFEQNSSGVYEKTIEGLAVGNDYNITESLHTKDGKTVTVSYKITDGISEKTGTGETATGIAINSGATTTVDYEDNYKYTDSGSLKFTKTFAGDITELTDTFKNGVTFTVKKGKQLIGTYELKDITPNTSGVYEKVIEGLPVGDDYSITESLYTIDGKTVTVSYNVNVDGATEGAKSGDTNSVSGISVKKNTTTTAAFTNTYADINKGVLKITKTIKGEITDKDRDGLTFTVKKGNKLIGTYILGTHFTWNDATNAYELILDDLDEGEDYTVTESVYTFDGKKVSVTYSVNDEEPEPGDTAKNVKVKTTSATTVAFEDDYKDIEYGNLQLTKTIKGDVTDEDLKGLKFTVYDDANKVIKEVKLSDFTKEHPASGDVKDNYTYTIGNLDVSKKYHVVETLTTLEGFDVTVKYTIGTNDTKTGTIADDSTIKTDDITITKNTTTDVAYENDYKKNTDTGSIKLTKTIKGDVTDEDLNGLKFTVYDDANKVIKEVKLSDFTKEHPASGDVKDNYTYTIGNLDVSKKYHVVETLTTLEGFDVTVKYTIGTNDTKTGTIADDSTIKTDDITITKNTTTDVAYENDYKKNTDTGSIKLTKTIKGDVTDEDLKGLKFTVYDDANKVIKEVKLSDFTKEHPASGDVKDNYTYTIDKLDVSKTYHVVETLTTLEGFDVTVKYTIGTNDTKTGTIADDSTIKTDDITITKNTTTDVAYENDYKKQTKPGKLIITKTIKGSVTPKEAAGALVFTITKENDATFTAKTVKLSDFIFDESSGKFTYTLDTTPGKYIVEETTYDVDGHEPISIKYTINGTAGNGTTKTTEGITVTSGGESAVVFEDEYKKKEESTSTDKGSLVVRKTFAGDSITDAQKKAVSFSVKKADGTDVAFFTYEKMNAMGDYTISDLEPGTYTVTETQYTVTGMKVTVTYETSTTGTGDKANVTVAAKDTARVNFTNTYTKEEEATTTEQPTTQATTTEEETTEEEDDDAKGTLVITIYDEKTGDVVPGAKIKVTSPNGKTKSYTTDKNGQVKISNTDAGTYKVVVTDVPEGYTVTENAEVEVEVKKNKVTKAKVKIDKEGSVTVTTRTSKTSAKTGDSVPVIPIAGTLILAIIGLIILIRKRQNV